MAVKLASYKLNNFDAVKIESLLALDGVLKATAISCRAPE